MLIQKRSFQRQVQLPRHFPSTQDKMRDCAPKPEIDFILCFFHVSLTNKVFNNLLRTSSVGHKYLESIKSRWGVFGFRLRNFELHGEAFAEACTVESFETRPFCLLRTVTWLMIRMVVVDQLVENVPNVLVGAVEELVLETPFGPALVPARKKLVPKSRPSRRQSRVTKVTKRNHKKK